MPDDRQIEIKNEIRNHQRNLFLMEQIEKDLLIILEKESGLESVKAKLGLLEQNRNEIVAKLSYDIGQRMDKVLAFGSSLFQIEDGCLGIFFVKEDGVRVPYRGLSGGEKVMFDAALASAIGKNGILVIEAAELDPVNLKALMKKLELSDDIGQVIVNTWAKPSGKISDKWNVVVMTESLNEKGEKNNA